MKRPLASALLTLLLFTPVLGQTTVEEFKTLAWDKSQRGTPLDLSQFQQTFRDDFDKLSVTADTGAGPWFAPGHTDFGAGKFLPPGPDGVPFSVKDGKLIVRAVKTVAPDGKVSWTAGNMQTVNAKGEGFAQQYGYFEMSAEFPPGPGTWMGFWLLSQNGYLDKTKTRTEIDAVEWYGGDPKGIHVTPHLWPAGQKVEGVTPLVKHVSRSMYYNANADLTDGKLQGFHTYGVEVTPDWVIAYFDRKETGRFKTLPEMRTPLYMLVTEAIFPKEADKADSPKDMVVDYVAAYARKEAGKSPASPAVAAPPRN